MSTEMMSLGMGHVVFPSEEVAALSTTPRAPRAAKYMAAMGLWRPQTGPAIPGRCRLRPATPARTIGTAFRLVRSLRQSDSGYSMSSLDDLARVMVIGACS